MVWLALVVVPICTKTVPGEWRPLRHALMACMRAAWGGGMQGAAMGMRGTQRRQAKRGGLRPEAVPQAEAVRRCDPIRCTYMHDAQPAY